MRNFIKLSWFLLGICSGLLGTISFAKTPFGTFSIKPYVFSIKGAKIAVAWSYNPKSAPDPQNVYLEMMQGTTKNTITPVLDKDLFVAELPIAVCDFGKDVSYEVTGQDSFTNIANIPCPGHVGGLTRFVFMADTQEGTEFANQFAKLAAQFKGAAVIIGGDLVQDGSKNDEWIKLFDAMDPVLSQQVLIPVIGNHEYRFDKDVPLWKNYFRFAAEDAHYSVDIGDAHVIVLNSNVSEDPSQIVKQLAWLAEELAKPAKWRLVVFHHPPYARGVMNNPDYPKKEFLTIQKDFVPVFEKYGVDLVLNGHTHIFERSVKNNINYLVTGAAGGKIGIYGGENPYSVMSDRVRTMIQLEASPSVLRVTTVTIDGKTMDQFVLNK